jgi:hypothetical protein
MSDRILTDDVQIPKLRPDEVFALKVPSAPTHAYPHLAAREDPVRVDQDQFGLRGNCQSACLATLLGIPLSEVPNWAAMEGNDQLKFDAMRSWLRAIGWDLMTVERGGMDAWPPRFGAFIAGGKSARGIDHAVIYRDGELWHDPHPDRTGIKSVETIDNLYPLNPYWFRLPDHERLLRETA